jgi:hypothetical protein
MARVILALSLLLSAPVFATVTNTIPQRGTVSGGDTVTITVDNTLRSNPITSPPSYYAEVTFDGVPARVLFAFGNVIRAVTPAHARGLAQIVVTSQGEPYGTSTFNYTMWGDPIEITNYERVLVPLLLPAGETVPGAFGSQWSGDLYARNRAASGVEFFSDITCTLVCPPIAFGIGYPALAADSLIKVTNIGPIEGRLYYLQKTYAKDVEFSLHIGDVSRVQENAGTEISVVRDGQFRSQSFDILNVPIDSLSRATLRVYDPDTIASSSADIAIYSMTNGALIASTNLPLPSPVTKPLNDLAVVAPAYAGFGQIGDIRLAFLFTQGTPFPPRVRINVTMKNGGRGWGFVSVTNNATQLITTYRPE